MNIGGCIINISLLKVLLLLNYLLALGGPTNGIDFLYDFLRQQIKSYHTVFKSVFY
jgi:hypothetical protein